VHTMIAPLGRAIWDVNPVARDSLHAGQAGAPTTNNDVATPTADLGATMAGLAATMADLAATSTGTARRSRQCVGPQLCLTSLDAQRA
jgi:hypothetical protein